jgi:hypothetical protein
MVKNMLKNLVNSVRSGQQAISHMPMKDKKALERKWDIEHAYYSSALEGSRIDKKEFDKLAEKVA